MSDSKDEGEELEISEGDVVWVELLDQQGGNPKIRPAVVVAPNATGTLFVVVAGTTKFDPEDPDPNVIQLPIGTKVQPSKTGLTEPTAIICDWFDTIDPKEVESRSGAVPDILFNAILNRVRVTWAERKANTPNR